MQTELNSQAEQYPVKSAGCPHKMVRNPVFGNIEIRISVFQRPQKSGPVFYKQWKIVIDLIAIFFKTALI